VASRLVEETGKPSFVVGFEGDEGIGSVRGSGHFNVYESLLTASGRLTRFGGHKDAAGFTVLRENLTALRTLLGEFAAKVDMTCSGDHLECDDKLRVSEIDTDLVAQIERLGPFGAGNPEPVFDIDGLYVLEQRVVGQEHLKLELKTPSGRISAFGPRMGEVAGKLPPLIRTAANLTFDEWRGNGEPELRLAAMPVEGS
jgi:single-stranded-DNA-specific exonuclease